MELMPGYKQSDVGVIPDDWDVMSLGKLTTLVASGRSAIGKQTGDYPVHGSTGIIGNTMSPEYEGDAILAARVGANAGRLNYVSGKYGVTDNTIIIRMNTDCCLPFFWRQLEAKRLNKLVFGSGQPLITGTQLKALPLAIPSVAEQRAIAQALSDVDALLATLDQMIAKKRDLKQASMQQLLSGKTRLPGFTGEWSRLDLNQLVSTPITDGPHMTPKFHKDGVPFLSVNNLVNNRIDLTDLRFISKEDDEIFAKKCKPRIGDVLLGKAASVGKVAIVESEFDFNIWSPIALIRPGELIDAKFLYYQLLGVDSVEQIMLLTNSSSQGNIGMGDIERIQISFPGVKEQAAIAAVLSEMDAELLALKSRRDKTRDLKQAMMQELLTGKTRLV